jgi:uncharacterized protein YdeI (YjbR/CyaY-like superfamily)
VRPPTRDEVRIFPDAAAFRRWLDEHHATDREVWVGYYRKGVDKPSITYREAVDEALCFGWIDGIGYRVDDESHTNRFTPRTRRSNWSAVNVRRVGELLAEGRMHPAGVAAFEARTPERTGVYSYENRPADLPEEYARRFGADEAAWAWWQAQTPSYRKAATWWVVSAKQEPTRLRRLEQLVADSAAGRALKMFSYTRRPIPGDIADRPAARRSHARPG